MSENKVSFFEDQIEDEAIALSDSELDNILGGESSEIETATEAMNMDDSSMIREEPDVIVIEKKDLTDFSKQTDDGMLPAEALLDEEPVPEMVADEPVDVAESLEEIPAMTTLDGEETLPLNEELPLEEVTGDQPSEVSELEAMPDIEAPEVLAEVIDPATFETSLVEEPIEMPVEESATEPSETPILEAQEETILDTPEYPAEEPVPELVEEASADSTFSAAEEPLSEPFEITEPESIEEFVADGSLEINETSMEDALPNLEMPVSEKPEALQVEEVPQETPAFEEMKPVSFTEEEPLTTADDLVLSENSGMPEELVIEETPEITLEDSPSESEPMATGEPQEIDFSEPDSTLSEESSPTEEVTEELTIFSGEENPKQKVEENGSFFEEADEDESITLSTDELSNILTDVEVEEKNGITPEPPETDGFDEVSGATTSSDIEETMSAMEGSSLSRENLKEVLVYIDNLLDKLPEDEIQKFARSKYYDLYNRLFEELGIV